MNKIIFSQIILLLCFFPEFPQVKQTLDERITQAVIQKLPEWKPQNSAAPFNFARGTYSAAIESDWKSGNRKANLNIYLLKTVGEIDENFRSFLMRQVIPPNRKIENLGERAHLVETASRVEVEFAKANVYAILTVQFPDSREDKKLPDYYARAPKEEVERALKFARVVADAIDGEKSFSPCLNNFHRQQFPAPTTLEEELLVAVQKGEPEAVKSLLAKRADPNYIFPDGNTVLHAAVRQGCVETFKALIAAKADVNAKNKKGETPLMVAANYGDLEFVKYLVSSGADVHAKDIYGRNAAFSVINAEQGMRRGFSAASFEDKSAVIKYLVGRGLNLNEKDTLDGNTVLTALLYNCYGSPDCKSLAGLFLDLGADVNAENKYGKTALIHSVERINATVQKEFVQFLLARGANPNHRDKNNLSALGYALKDQKLYQNDKGYFTKHIEETIRLLKDAGAIE